MIELVGVFVYPFEFLFICYGMSFGICCEFLFFNFFVFMSFSKPSYFLRRLLSNTASCRS